MWCYYGRIRTSRTSSLLWAQYQVMVTFVNSFSWGTSKTMFSIKICNSKMPCHSKWGLVMSSDLENIFSNVWLDNEAIVSQDKLQKHFRKELILLWCQARKNYIIIITNFKLLLFLTLHLFFQCNFIWTFVCSYFGVLLWMFLSFMENKNNVLSKVRTSQWSIIQICQRTNRRHAKQNRLQKLLI